MKQERTNLTPFFVLSLVLLVLGTNLLAFARESDSRQLVWVEHENGQYDIYYARSQGQGWGEKIKLSSSGGANRVPAMAMGRDNRTWVVWASLKNINDGAITARYQENGQWSDLLNLPSGYSFNTAPSIAVDSENRPWVVWAAWDGEDDEILASHWDGKRWSEAQRVNIDDKQPDILPVIGIGANDKPWVYWQGLEQGRYRQFISHWTGDAWSKEQRLDDNNPYSALLNRTAESMPALPDFVRLPHEAVLLGERTGEIQSISRRFQFD